MRLRVSALKLLSKWWMIPVAALLAWAAWSGPLPFLGLLLLFGLVVMSGETPFHSYLAAFAYYAVVSIDVPHAFSTYANSGLPQSDPFINVIGWVIWFLTAAFLAAFWAVAKWFALYFSKKGIPFSHALATIVTLFITTGPVVGWVHWAHPLLASGVVFPGFGWWSVLATALVIAFYAEIPRLSLGRRSWLVAHLLLASAILVTNIQVREKISPLRLMTKVYAIQVHDGNPRSYETYRRRLAVLRRVLEEVNASGWRSVIVLTPESYGREWSKTFSMLLWPHLERFKEQGGILLVGLARPRPEMGSELFAYGAVEGVVYRNRVQPPSDYLLAAGTEYGSGVIDPDHSPIVRLKGDHVFMAICFESFLMNHLMAALSEGVKPDYMLVSSNIWMIRGKSAFRINRLSIEMMSRILGVPYRWAYNV